MPFWLYHSATERKAAWLLEVAIEHSEDREEQAATQQRGLLPPLLAKQLFRHALISREIRTNPLADLELPTVEQLAAEAIAATFSQRINTPTPELQHAQRMADTLSAAGINTSKYPSEPGLLRVGDDSLCAISFGKEDEEFAATLGLAVALTSTVALLRAIHLRTVTA